MPIAFRQPKRQEVELLVEIGESTGIFATGVRPKNSWAKHSKTYLVRLFGMTYVDCIDQANSIDGKLPSGHQAHVLVHDNAVKGWTYFGPAGRFWHMESMVDWH
jgi:hypothetical protein